LEVIGTFLFLKDRVNKQTNHSKVTS